MEVVALAPLELTKWLVMLLVSALHQASIPYDKNQYEGVVSVCNKACWIYSHSSNIIAILQRLRSNSGRWEWDHHSVSSSIRAHNLALTFIMDCSPPGVDFPGYYNDNTPGLVYNVRPYRLLKFQPLTLPSSFTPLQLPRRTLPLALLVRYLFTLVAIAIALTRVRISVWSGAAPSPSPPTFGTPKGPLTGLPWSTWNGGGYIAPNPQTYITVDVGKGAAGYVTQAYVPAWSTTYNTPKASTYSPPGPSTSSKPTTPTTSSKSTPTTVATGGAALVSFFYRSFREFSSRW